MREVFRWLRILLTFIVCVAIGSILFVMALSHWFEGIERDRLASLVPAVLGTAKVVYAKEENYGFGPGGNETGVLVYELTSSIAANIETGGLAYLQARMAPAESSYSKWQATPLRADENWREKLADDAPVRLDDLIKSYGYGWPIVVDPGVEAAIDQALGAAGNFYAYGRGTSVIIVSPSARRVFVVYAG